MAGGVWGNEIGGNLMIILEAGDKLIFKGNRAPNPEKYAFFNFKSALVDSGEDFIIDEVGKSGQIFTIKTLRENDNQECFATREMIDDALLIGGYVLEKNETR